MQRRLNDADVRALVETCRSKPLLALEVPCHEVKDAGAAELALLVGALGELDARGNGIGACEPDGDRVHACVCVACVRALVLGSACDWAYASAAGA